MKKSKDIIHESNTSEQIQLLDALIQLFEGKSRNFIKGLLTHRQIMIDGKVETKFDYIVKKGQKITVLREGRKAGKPLGKINILYEDENIIVINKQAGLLTIASVDKRQETAYKLVMEYIKNSNPTNRIYIVHRIDKDTSGVLLFAKNEKIKIALQDNWNDLVIKREYLAIVEGHPKSEDTIKSYLLETSTQLMYSSKIKTKDSELAITNYKTIKSNNKYSLLKVNIETGKKNQIRVHLKDIGFPITGDKKYGSKTNPLKRLGLHACNLELINPFSKKLLTFTANVPSKFASLFNEN